MSVHGNLEDTQKLSPHLQNSFVKWGGMLNKNNFIQQEVKLSRIFFRIYRQSGVSIQWTPIQWIVANQQTISIAFLATKIIKSYDRNDSIQWTYGDGLSSLNRDTTVFRCKDPMSEFSTTLLSLVELKSVGLASLAVPRAWLRTKSSIWPESPTSPTLLAS